MKTAISVPDDTYAQVTQRARDLGMSRSEFFARAAANFLDELAKESETAAINGALDAATGGDGSNAAAAAAGRLVTRDADDW